MQSETSVNVVPISATIRADQRDRLVSFAKHSGAISISEALRELLDKVLPPLVDDGGRDGRTWTATSGA